MICWILALKIRELDFDHGLFEAVVRDMRNSKLWVLLAFGVASQFLSVCFLLTCISTT